MLIATKNLFRDMFKYEGKLTRPEFWWGYLGLCLIIVITSIPVIALEIDLNATPNTIIVILLAFFMEYIVMVAGSKRIRDAGYPWYLIFMYFFPIFGQIAVIILLCLPTSDKVLSK